MRAPGTNTVIRAGTDLVQDINAIAVKDLEDRRARVTAKALTRAVIKQEAVDAMADSADDKGTRAVLRLTGAVFAAVTELADTRSWGTLPGEIHLARSFVPPGRYVVSSIACGKSRYLGEIEINPGQTRIFVVQTMY